MGSAKCSRLCVSGQPPRCVAQSQTLLLHKLCPALVEPRPLSCPLAPCPWSPDWAELVDIPCKMPQGEGSSARQRGLASPARGHLDAAGGGTSRPVTCSCASGWQRKAAKHSGRWWGHGCRHWQKHSTIARSSSRCSIAWACGLRSLPPLP